MNIKTEKKKYTPPCMELVDYTREAALLVGSDYGCDGECVDPEGIDEEGYNGGFN